jgi:hypothetical protein
LRSRESAVPPAGCARIADAAGIPLQPEQAEMTADFFAGLDIGRFRREKT